MVLEYDACSVRDVIVFPSFLRFRVNELNRFEYATLKKCQFSKISGYLWAGSKPDAF